MYQIMINRLALSPVCNSRFLLPEYGVETLPFGHYSLLGRVAETVPELPYSSHNGMDNEVDSYENYLRRENV
jgi:hypothetical protein